MAIGTAYIYVTGVVEREGDQWVSFCEELGTASCGDTPEEAFGNLDEALQVYLETLAEYGELDRVFGERGIVVGRDSTVEAVADQDETHRITRTRRVEMPMAGKPNLDPVRHRAPERTLGALKGKLWMSPDFDEASPELIRGFEGR